MIPGLRHATAPRASRNAAPITRASSGPPNSLISAPIMLKAERDGIALTDVEHVQLG